MIPLERILEVLFIDAFRSQRRWQNTAFRTKTCIRRTDSHLSQLSASLDFLQSANRFLTRLAPTFVYAAVASPLQFRETLAEKE